MRFHKSSLLLLLSLLPMGTFALEGSWHVGLGAGVSTLSPDVGGSGFTLDDKQSTAIGLNLGIDVLPHITAEVSFTDLGEASLSGGQSVGYQALSLGAVAYVLGEKDAFSRQEGLSTYIRIGVNSIDNDAKLALVESNNTALWLGAGVQWPMSRSLALRGEVTSFDGDAQALMASIVWRTDGVGKRPVARAPITPVPVAKPSGVEPAPEILPKDDTVEAESTNATPLNFPAEKPTQKPVAPVRPVAPASATVDACPANAALQITNTRDCIVLSSVVKRLDFFAGSDRITLAGKSSLDSVTTVLKRYPQATVEIRVHTERFANPDLAADLARQRAIAVARYLVAQGIKISQLRARSFGDSVPRSSNSTPRGRRANNRVELRVL